MITHTHSAGTAPEVALIGGIGGGTAELGVLRIPRGPDGGAVSLPLPLLCQPRPTEVIGVREPDVVLSLLSDSCNPRLYMFRAERALELIGRDDDQL